MKKKTLVLSIDDPCKENWNDMELDEQGRFCKKCEKIVVDFTSMSDKEISRIITEAKNNDKRVCGRLKKSQLNRPLDYHEHKSQRYFALPVLVSSTLLLNSLNLDAAENKENEKTIVENVAVATNDDEYIVRGTIIDEDGQPVSFARISYFEKSDSKAILCVTNEEGNFHFTTKNLDAFNLTIQHNDYKTKIELYNRTNIEGSISITLQCKSTADWNSEYCVMEGRVTDMNGKPLPGATVKVLGTKRGANAKADGSFRIVKLPKGKCEIEVSYIGYHNNNVSVVLEVAKDNIVFVQMKGNDLYNLGVITGAVDYSLKEMVRKEQIGTERRIKF